MKSPLAPSPDWAINFSNRAEKERIKEILSQEFNYLGSGAQCFAFLSADGKYVLKFFRMKHLVPKTWLKWVPFPGLDEYRFQKIDKRILRQKELFRSYKLAYEDLQEETGLVYIHLNKGKNLKVNARLYDRMRNLYIAPLDEYEFVLQLRSQLVHERLISYMQKRDFAGARRAIHNLLEMVVRQSKKGYVDRDPGVSHNYGYVGDRVVHFDVGKMLRDDAATEPSYYHREVLRFGEKLSSWLEVHYPELLPLLEEEVNEMIGLTPHH